jgi:hypothetical protein
MQIIMILPLIALAAAFGFNYAFFDLFHQAYLRNRDALGPALQSKGVAGALWLAASTLVIYTPLQFLGLSNALTGVLAWVATCKLSGRYLRTVTERTIILTESEMVSRSVYWGAPVAFFISLALALDQALAEPMVATQCLVAATALMVAGRLDRVVRELAEERNYHTAAVALIRAAAFPLAASALGRTLMVLVDTFVEEPVWTVINFMCGYGAVKFFDHYPQYVPDRVASTVLRLGFELVTGLALYYFTIAAWLWPLPVAMVVIALVYTWLAMRHRCDWVDRRVPFPFKAFQFAICYSVALAAVCLVYYYPLLLAPVPFVMACSTDTTRVDKTVDTTPTLEELQHAYDHHAGSWKLTSLSHRTSLELRVHVPTGEEATWHRYAANYYREVLRNQYFLELPQIWPDVDEILTAVDTATTAPARQHDMLDEPEAPVAHRNMQKRVNEHIRINFRRLRRSLRPVAPVIDKRPHVTRDVVVRDDLGEIAGVISYQPNTFTYDS